MTWKEIIDTLGIMWNTFLNKWFKITLISLGVYIIFPIIRGSLLAIKYMIFKTPELESQFVESSIKSLIPWYLNFLIEPVNGIIGLISLIILVTAVYSIGEE